MALLGHERRGELLIGYLNAYERCPITLERTFRDAN